MKNPSSLLTIIIIFIFSTNIVGQSFERTYKADSLIFPCHVSNHSYGVNVKKVSNGFVFLSNETNGSTTNCTSTGTIAYKLTRINNIGDTIYTKLFLEPSYLIDNIGSFTPSEFSIALDGSIYVTGEVQEDFNGTIKMFVNKHNITGDFIWSKYFSYNYIASGNTIFIDSNSIYIGGVTAQAFGQNESPLLIKIDTTGNLIWDYIFPNSAFSEFNKILKVNNTFYSIGRIMPTTTTNNKYKIFISKFDSSGNISTPYFFGDSTYTYRNIDAIETNQNQIVVSSSEALSNKNLVLKIDTSLNVVNQFYIQGISNQNIYVSNSIIQLTDSSYILSGHKEYPALSYFSSLYIQKLNQIGQIYWEREYSGVSSDCISLDSNNLILVGNRLVSNASNSSLNSNTLLIKTDSTGLTDLCIPKFYANYSPNNISDSLHLGIKVLLINNSYGLGPFSWYLSDTLFSNNFNDYFYANDTGWVKIELIACNDTFVDSIYIYNPSVSINEFNNRKKINLYPNPSSNTITIDIKEDISSITIISITGKLIKTVDKSNNTINVTDLPKGIYFVKLIVDGVVNVEKFIKN